LASGITLLASLLVCFSPFSFFQGQDADSSKLTRGNGRSAAPVSSTAAIYTQTPDDSGVAGLVGVVNPSTGIVTPVVIGFAKPTGMIFVPNS